METAAPSANQLFAGMGKAVLFTFDEEIKKVAAQAK